MFENILRTRLLSIIATAYFAIYSIFLLTKLFSPFNFGTMNAVFFTVILLTLIGLWGLWKQQKFFNKLFWKYFSTFQLLIAVSYFYTTYKVMVIMSPIFIIKILLFLPLYFAILFYANKNGKVWGTPEDGEVPTLEKINTIFFVGLVFITAAYNPFLQEQVLTPADYNSLGVQSGNRGDLFGEKRFYMMGLKAAKKLKQEDTAPVGKIYLNLSSYSNMGLDFKASILYATKAIKLYQDLLDKKKIDKKSSEYLRLGDAYYLAGASAADMDLNQRVLYLNQAMAIYTELKDNEGLARCNESLGNAYRRAKDYKKSKLYFEKAEKIALKNNLIELLAHNYSVYADSLLDQKKYAEAEEIGLKAINILKNNGAADNYSPFTLGKAYATIGEIYQAQGKCEEARENYSIGMPMLYKRMSIPLPTEFMIKLRNDECKAIKTSKKKEMKQ